MAQAAPASSDAQRERRRTGRSESPGSQGRLPSIESCNPNMAARGRGCLGCDVRHLALCAALRQDALPHLEAIVSPVSLGPGRMLFGEGDPVRHAYIVVAGILRLVRLLSDGRRQITGFGLAGDFVGLSAEGAHPCGAETVDSVELCQFPIRRLHELFTSFPEMEHRLLAMRSAELVAAHERMVLLGRKTPVEKIATFLLEVSARQKARGRPPSPVILPMTRSDIADYLGLTVETVSRCFTRLKTERSIALPEPTSVTLLERDRLQRLAYGD